ncbi:hypothetical protein [Hydrogenovibrio thermophilus]|jgi:hypothetical protein|uniref:DUF4148 domain-containing protein n=1 Tax=Hydrogenovibrio thermophilus TaxID=265883 RepID=A0A410H2I7_9GAMM|nr:hypothetical protein [Hydrogenovibrio thermophilus]QAB15122.1 hypothetical protein EPV75_05275 [Hydrogenovibrio thermophilus]
MKQLLIASTLASVLALSGLPAISVAAQDGPQQMYGSQLMTPQERAEHREKMRNAKTEEERNQIRAENHARMQERAKEQGVTLPDSPPAGGAGMGYRQGMGGGMGPGNGMRQGGGMGGGMGGGNNR